MTARLPVAWCTDLPCFALLSQPAYHHNRHLHTLKRWMHHPQYFVCLCLGIAAGLSYQAYLGMASQMLILGIFPGIFLCSHF
jgi:isoprenylcysteine carboxyl methyltransferase (ICMT) family protein YpbQ